MAEHRQELTPQMLVDEIDEALQAVPTAASQAGAAAGAEAGGQAFRRGWRWVVAAVLAVALVVSTAVSVIAVGLATDAQSVARAAEISRAERDADIDAALRTLQESNADLVARGQAPVQTGPEPDPAEALAAAVTARVLALLPPDPTAEQVGALITGAVTANLAGPSRAQLTALVVEYFRDNPPQPGPAPSEAAIQAAVDRAYAANPPPAGRDGLNGDPGRGIVSTATEGCFVVLTFDQPPLEERVGPFCPDPTDTDVTTAPAPDPPLLGE